MNLRTTAVTVVLALVNAAAVASLSSPVPEPFAPGTLLVLERGDGAVAAFDTEGLALPQPVTGLTDPVELAFAADGTLWITDRGPDAVLVRDAANQHLGSLGEEAGLQDVAGLAFGPAGHLYVASQGTDRIAVFDRAGTLLRLIGEGSGLLAPWGLAFGAEGRLYVASEGSDSVLVFDTAGTLLAEWGVDSGLSQPRGLAFGPEGRLHVASYGSDEVFVLDAQGEAEDVWGGPGQLDGPTSLAFGPDGRLHVSCADGGEVAILDADGEVVSLLAPLAAPSGLAFAPSVFSTQIKGTLQRPGESRLKVKASALISVSPGLGQVSVRLLDADGALAATFGSDSFTLPGFWASGDLHSKRRAFAGEQVAPAAALGGLFGVRGLSALHLDAFGKAEGTFDASPDTPWFTLRRIAGRLDQAAPEGVFGGGFKSSKLLAP